MSRPLLFLLLAAGAGAAEVARRDVQVAAEVVDGGFTYALDSGIGTFTGDDAFDRIGILRLGGRWAWTSAGNQLAPLLGLDAEMLDAPLAGGGLDGQGLALAAGGTWAFAGPLALDLEGFVGLYQASLELPGAGGSTGFSGDGSMQRTGLRARLAWSLTRHWTMALEGGWSAWSADIAGGDDRTLTLDGSGLGAGLALAWRPSARPGSVE
jgi:hypothetical protein